ncbi:MAG: NADPH:quinone oxidoreductase family protein [Phenylobacterium sp.]|uniref:NADPH:quinone oxidoreductase family protein n=1 Tax=Phenylobacterium sp. TaxID=1871053 RepID=UPI00273668C5|nr:NADPH:quinone oxidoreductase family protein [Phenylobacterium sp.]MDP3749615.1 NADPH:quinone oxidoreductase family protein [Phenylobacterium sp.]
MKAVLCKAFGPPEALTIEDVPSPEPQDDQVVIAVHAAAVNFPDTLIVQNKYQFKPALPFSPGSEVAGRIVKVGARVTSLKPGDRVIGQAMWGGFAEELAVHESGCTPIPDQMDFNTAAAFLMTYGTSHYALRRRAAIQPGETLLVLGAAGGVGLAAVELGKAMGARVIAAASSPEKLKTCVEHGADATILYPSHTLGAPEQKAFSEEIKAKTGGQGADVVYDPVGGAYSEPALRATNWGGRFLVVGFAAGGIPNVPLNLPLLKGCSVVGVFWGGYTARDRAQHKENVAELMAMYRHGDLAPHISSLYPLERAADALVELESRRAIGKVVLTVERSDELGSRSIDRLAEVSQ